MQRIVIGVVLATVVMYAWGFLYWGASSVPYTTWKQTADDTAAAAALRTHFTESGVYFVPGLDNPPERRTALYSQGPTGFVIVDVDGRPEFDPGIMVRGFLLNGVVAALLALLMQRAGSSLPTYGARLGFAALAGAFAVVLVNFGDAVWWALPWSWELVQAFYNFSAVVVAGAILARFVVIHPPAAS
jgi:hypothetical protein